MREADSAVNGKVWDRSGVVSKMTGNGTTKKTHSPCTRDEQGGASVKKKKTPKRGDTKKESENRTGE